MISIKCFLYFFNYLIIISGCESFSRPVALASTDSLTFICPDQFGHFPDADDCSRYFVCDHGKPDLHECTDGLFYSTIIKTCDWPRNVDCQRGRTGIFKLDIGNSLTRNIP